jgi:HPt (histidine-containing phosphotransfer) domain-containing protein
LTDILKVLAFKNILTKDANEQEMENIDLPKNHAPLTIYDKEALFERMIQDEDLVKVVLRGFLEDIPKQIQILKDFLSKQDQKGCIRQVHSIKGASANIGAEALRAVSADLEKMGKEGDLNYMHDHLADLEMEFARLKAVLDKEI